MLLQENQRYYTSLCFCKVSTVFCDALVMHSFMGEPLTALIGFHPQGEALAEIG